MIRSLIYNLINIFTVILNFSSKRYIPITTCDKKLLILGNGKSLNDANLENSSQIDYMVVNRHVKSDNYVEIKPKYYVLADPHFFSHPEGMEIIEMVNSRTTWEMYLCIPFDRKNRRIKESLHLRENIKVILYNKYTIDQNRWYSSLLYNKQLAMPRVQNVVVAAIMLGILMEYKIIELYGVEHNWLSNLYVGDDNLVYLRNDHFFDKDKVAPKPQRDIQNLDFYPLHANIMDYANMFKSYWEIKQYLKISGKCTRIINKTKGSFIDAFDRS